MLVESETNLKNINKRTFKCPNSNTGIDAAITVKFHVNFGSRADRRRRRNCVAQRLGRHQSVLIHLTLVSLYAIYLSTDNRWISVLRKSSRGKQNIFQIRIEQKNLNLTRKELQRCLCLIIAFGLFKSV